LPATLRNLLVTFLLGGIWHGAAWTFAIWGMLHGLACCAHRLWLKTGVRMPAVAAVAITFLFVNATWVFFRALDLAAALQVLAAMATPTGTSGVLPSFLWAMVGFVGILVWAAPVSPRLALQTKAGAHPFAALLAGAAVLAVIVAQNLAAPSPFLYFNF
jgi:alginate O-acetyltransferase complex protein AlgI